MIVGPVTPAITAELQETADAFLKVGVISKPYLKCNVTVVNPRKTGGREGSLTRLRDLRV